MKEAIANQFVREVRKRLEERRKRFVNMKDVLL